MYEFFPGNYRWSYNTLLALCAGGQVGDIEMVWRRLKDRVGDDEAWHREWAWLADVLEKRARDSATRDSASDNYFLSSLYHTISEHFIPPAEPKRMASYGEVLRNFELGRAAAPFKLERVEVPFEGKVLPGYFLAAPGAGRHPSIILVCGLDTTKELWFMRVRAALAQRGMNALFLDTPGIGEALRYGKLYTRPDYEKPIGAAIDWLQTRAEVDANRIGIIGSSLGGFYVSRAAAYEPRLKAAVAWGAIYDYHAVWVRRMTVGGTLATPSFQLMFITGTSSMPEAMEKVRDFRIPLYGERITCPFLVMHGAEDQQVSKADAQAMFEAIGSKDKTLKIFTGEDGGPAHCQFDNHLPALQFAADWLVTKLMPERVKGAT